MLTKVFFKRYLFLLIHGILGCWVSVYATNTELADSLHLSVKLLRENNYVKLRWVTPNAYLWKNAQFQGFKIERFTIKRDSEFLAIPDYCLLQDTLTAVPLKQWENVIKSNNYAAVVAQAIYGESFALSTSSNSQTDIPYIVAQSNELEQRFWVSMYAADLDFNVARMAGWGYVDSTIKANEEYLYRVYCADTTLQQKVSYGVAVTDVQEELPTPNYFKGNFGDKVVLLSWDITHLRSHYVAYQVERSTDHVNYSPCFSPFVMNMSGKDIIIVPDSLPENNKTYYYRLYGITPFGERGPYSSVIKGEGFKPLSVSPDITSYYVDDLGILNISWDIDSVAQEQIKCFELRRSISETSGFQTVVNNISSDKRSLKYANLLPSNYFVLAAIPHKGYETASLPFFIQTVDSIPPAAPTGLIGKIDSTGVVKLSWDKNNEEDIYGYRIFKRLSNEGKLFFMNDIAIKENSFTDTISLNDLNPFVYYAVAALDGRYNQSTLSDTLKLVKPDIIPPTSPALRAFKSDTEGISLEWVSSSSEDAKSTIIYRSNTLDANEFSEVKILNIQANEWTDSLTTYGKTYHYVLKTEDLSGNISEATPVISVTAKTKTENTLKLNIDYLPQGRLLTWKLKSEISSGIYELYRAINGQKIRLWKKLPSTESSIADVENPENRGYSYFIKFIPSKGYPIFSNQVK
jgi:hypothetical protein